MPVPTPQEVADQVLTDALSGVAEVEGDQGRVKMMSADDRLAAAGAAAAVSSGYSGWGGVLRARVVPPGAQ